MPLDIGRFPGKAAEDVRFGRHRACLRVVIIKAHELLFTVDRIAKGDGKEPVPVAASPIARLHVAVVGPVVVDFRVSVLGIIANGVSRFLVKHLLTQSLVNDTASVAGQFRRPCLVECPEHCGKTSVASVRNDDIRPTFQDFLHRKESLRAGRNGNQEKGPNECFFHDCNDFCIVCEGKESVYSDANINKKGHPTKSDSLNFHVML